MTISKGWRFLHTDKYLNKQTPLQRPVILLRYRISYYVALRIVGHIKWSRPSACPSVSFLRFSWNKKAAETANLVET